MSHTLSSWFRLGTRTTVSMSTEDQKCNEILPKCAEIPCLATITHFWSFGTKLCREQRFAEKVHLERVFGWRILFARQSCIQDLMDMLCWMELGPETWKWSSRDSNEDLYTLWMNSDGFLVFRTHPRPTDESMMNWRQDSEWAQKTKNAVKFFQNVQRSHV